MDKHAEFGICKPFHPLFKFSGSFFVYRFVLGLYTGQTAQTECCDEKISF